MANESKQNSPRKVSKFQAGNDLELLKMIIDSDPVLKRKVIRFMQKNYSKITGPGSK